MHLLSGRIKETLIISIVVIVILSYGLFFYLQSITESNIRYSLFEQQKMRQIDSTRDVSEHIGSDISLAVAMLDTLANSFYLQQGDVAGDGIKKLMEEKYIQFNTIIDRLFILDKDDIMVNSFAPLGSETFLGIDFSFRDWVKETKSGLTPVFSNGFERQDVYRIFITYPIVNRETGQYIGLVGLSIPTVNFFAHYGNVLDINSQFLVVFDGNATLLAVGASQELVGKNFFGDYAQRFINHNTILNNLTRNLLDGNSGSAVYDYGQGERLTTAYPIFVNDKPIYFIQIVTPTSQIYTQINEVLLTERLKMFSLLAGTTAAIAVLIIFLVKWSSTLGNEVKRRTRQLNVSNQRLYSKTAELKLTNESLIESNKKLESANKRLEVHDKMQKDFINIAAHELRTPIQPILALTQVLRSRKEKNNNGKEIEEELSLLDAVIRNAKRLQRLAEDILDVTKIESHSLILHKERFNLNEVISNTIQDISRNQISNGKVKLRYEFDKDLLFIEADKERITQVISNLLSNAVKFTKEGTISISVEKKDSKVTFNIKDTGTGIDSEILPRLFTKFASKSFEGTGLGLFVSKSIVEAHGGKMWAENNADGNGASFSFSLPLNKQEQEQLKSVEHMNQ
ncbi:MAG: sensor histidine kinase [Thermoproteota archaeon]|nr:sensor histidine kinase [Thermoproteota archaeon]MDQ4022372.1 sensor histidine kinase [Thermoproteota archaeon]